MARFQFRLKTLLAVREAARDECQAQLAEAYREQRKLEVRRAWLNAELSVAQVRVRADSAPGRVDVDRLLTTDRYESVLRLEGELLAEQERQSATKIERQRQAVEAADREVRVLEKLQAKQLEQYRQQQSLAESKLLDEVAARLVRPDGA